MISKGKMKKLYWNKGMTQQEIADLYDVHRQTIRNWMNKLNISSKRKFYKKDNKQFKKEVYELVKDEYIFMEKYNGAKNKIKCKHNKCGHEYKVTPDDFLYGRRCPKCNGKFRKTTKEFKNEVRLIANGNYKVLGEYKNAHNKIKIKHKKCSNVFKITPNHFLRGNRCPRCAKKKRKDKLRKTTSEFKEEVKDITNGNYRLMSEYYDRKTKVTIKHLECGREWRIPPRRFISGQRCPFCEFEKQSREKRLSIDEVKTRIKEAGNDNFKLISNYKNTHTKITLKHKHCNRKFKVTLNNFIKNPHCRKCGTSCGEDKIRDLFEKHDIQYEEQATFGKCRNQEMLPFDFKIKLDNKIVLIEYNGIQHYKPVKFFGGYDKYKRQLKHDEIKKEFCDKNNIELIVIPYYNKNRIEKILEPKIYDWRGQKCAI